MKAVVFTLGTRGDVQPYIYLAHALEKHGHTLTIVTHPWWRSIVEEEGVKFLPIGPDLNIEKETAILRGMSKLASGSRMMKIFLGIMSDYRDEIVRICRENDLLVVSHSIMASAEGQALGIPMVHVALKKGMIPHNKADGASGLTFRSKLMGRGIAMMYGNLRKLYQLAPAKCQNDIIAGKYVMLPMSSLVIPPKPYADPKYIMTGYWYEEEEYTPDDKLRDFLEKGEKPAILALGAMSFEDGAEREKLDMFVNAFQKTGQRAIIQGFKETLKNYTLPDNMIACGSVPHCWLFRQGSFVIHHCGFGTASAALLYGIPSVPVPHIVDQDANAKELYATGTAVKPIRAKKLTEENVIRAIEEMKRTLPEKRNIALELSAKLRSENGLEKAVRLMEDALSN